VNHEARCPLCKRPATHRGLEPGRDVVSVECECCGRFRITPTAISVLKPDQAFGLSSGPPITILSDNIVELLSSLPHYSPFEKMEDLLRLLGDQTTVPGEVSRFVEATDWPLLALSNPNIELPYLFHELEARKFIERKPLGAKVTMKGWERLAEISREGRTSPRCFVAMWFDKSMDGIYDQGIEPAIRHAGYDPLRIDKAEHVNRIDDEIIGQIKRSRFMVSDFTGQRHGVYFEAGMMQGLGRNVIWMCRRDELLGSKLHFDVRQFNFIDYETAAEAKEGLYRRILAVEGEGPLVTG
jgi:hypothetical protein